MGETDIASDPLTCRCIEKMCAFDEGGTYDPKKGNNYEGYYEMPRAYAYTPDAEDWYYMKHENPLDHRAQYPFASHWLVGYGTGYNRAPNFEKLGLPTFNIGLQTTTDSDTGTPHKWCFVDDECGTALTAAVLDDAPIMSQTVGLVVPQACAASKIAFIDGWAPPGTPDAVPYTGTAHLNCDCVERT